MKHFVKSRTFRIIDVRKQVFNWSKVPIPILCGTSEIRKEYLMRARFYQPNDPSSINKMQYNKSTVGH